MLRPYPYTSSSSSTSSLFSKAKSWSRQFANFLISPIFAAFIYFVAGLYTNSVLQVVADRQTVHCGEGICPPSPDLGHELFPHLTFVKICDYWLYGVVALTVIRFSPIFLSRSLSLVLFRRWLFLQGSMFWMRGISVALTRQSIPQEGCVTTATGNPFIEGFYIMSGMHITCGDIMFSGHTAGITLATLIWTHYSKGEEFSICCGDNACRPWVRPNLDAVGDPATCSLTSILAWAIAGTGFFFIIATHFHYSNDVFIGCILTQFVFRVYHYYIKTVLELPGIWAKIFQWFEGFDKSLKEHLLPTSELRRNGVGDKLIPSEQEIVTSPNGTQRYAVDVGIDDKDRDPSFNRHEFVRPLTGVGVAVFSEGPKSDSSKRMNPTTRLRDDLTSKSSQHDHAVSDIDHEKNIAILQQSYDNPTPSALHDFPYHMHFDLSTTNSSSSRLVDQTPRQPVIVAGEIAEQEAKQKRNQMS